jgi:carboxyl-terminal processing protease
MKRKNNFFSNLKKKILKGKNKFTIVEAISFMVVTFALGMIVGGIIMYGKETYKGSSSSSLDDFISTYNDILNNYYQPVDAEKLLEAGINGMVNYLGDPYSIYMDKEDSEEFNMVLDGKYSGIGAEIQQLVETGEIKILEVYKDSPAEQAGLKKNDIIFKVNGEEIKGLSAAEVSGKVKGETGTKVDLTIKRGEEIIDVTLTRGSVDIPSVTSEIIEKNNKTIGYIYVSVFAENTDSQFKAEVEKLEKDHIDSLIIDLRQNSGGHLKTVTNMISMFIKKDEVIYKLKTKDNVEEFKDQTDEHRTYPIAIVIDNGSASASEVFTAALKEKYGATIVGEKSFGKGKVQKAYNLSNGAMIKYTYQEWLTPDGNYIDQQGIEPNIKVEYSYKNGDKYDSQVLKAIEEMSK